MDITAASKTGGLERRRHLDPMEVRETRQEDILQIWKIALVSAIVGAAVTAAGIHYSFIPFGRGDGHALAAHGMDSRSPVAVPDPVISSQNSSDIKTSDSEHGWGPFRTVDW